MPPLESEYWLNCLKQIDFALQPIVNIHTGVCYGVEALLRNVELIGFSNIASFFDRAFKDGVLHQMDIMLRHKAIDKLATLEMNGRIKLFFNLDNRLLSSGDYQTGSTLQLLKKHALHQDAICFEISERHQVFGNDTTLNILKSYRNQGFKIAVDDFGTGFSGLQTFYFTEPDFVKIDRFFIQDIATDHKKRLFVRNIVNTAHIMGCTVVAEGVETEAEYFGCRDIGCDLIQGYLVQRPQINVWELQQQYRHILELSQSDQRSRSSHDQKLINMQLEPLEPLVYSDDVFDIFEYFRSRQQITLAPVITKTGEPLGVIRESTLKGYAYSPYGRDLLKNATFTKKVRQFISRFPVADIHTSIEEVLQIYSRDETLEGILITENMHYKGFLSASSLLKILNEKNLTIARDQNPLTRLPGNTLIHEYVSTALNATQTAYSLIYYDFDNFKPFNDKYGFRNGDRLILLFADLLKKKVREGRIFAGHVGGDDFFMGFQDLPQQTVEDKVQRMIQQFRQSSESFYDAESIAQGFMTGINREGQPQRFPLIGVSAVVLHLPAGRSIYSTDEISRAMAECKKKAKHSPSGMHIHHICITNTDCCTPHSFQTFISESDFQASLSYKQPDGENPVDNPFENCPNPSARLLTGQPFKSPLNHCPPKMMPAAPFVYPPGTTVREVHHL